MTRHRVASPEQYHMHGCRGFTLIEMVAVIVIIGLLSAAAILSLAHSSSQHRLDGLCQQLQQADALARSAARQSARVQHLIFDMDRNQVLWADGDEPPVRMVALAHEDSMELKTAEGRTTQGQVVIDCSANGFSQSYVLTLEARDQPTRQMIVAGLSGRIVWTKDEKEADTILDSLADKAASASADAP